MFLSVLLGFCAAFGVLSILWVCCGCFLPGSTKCEAAVFCPAGRELDIIRRFCWLRELGLVRWRLAVINSRLNKTQQRMVTERFPYIRFVSREQWLFGSGKEPEDVATAGDGNITGLRCSSDISELR